MVGVIALHFMQHVQKNPFDVPVVGCAKIDG